MNLRPIDSFLLLAIIIAGMILFLIFDARSEDAKQYNAANCAVYGLTSQNCGTK